jgi:hypothetical protein
VASHQGVGLFTAHEPFALSDRNAPRRCPDAGMAARAAAGQLTGLVGPDELIDATPADAQGLGNLVDSEKPFNIHPILPPSQSGRARMM